MKKTFTELTFAMLALVGILSYGYWRNDSAQAQSITLPNTSIYFLTTDNTIYVLTPGTNRPRKLVKVRKLDGALIGIDFRPAEANANVVYGLTDTGQIYTISLAAGSLGEATPVSKLSPRFAGGFQALMDFNPVVNAVRVIGSNDQNFAAVNSNGNLNVTAVQTKLAYDPKDVNAGVDPNITAGGYTNNFAGAANTLFYMIDYDLDTFVTISSISATGSSNTGGGQLQTIGPIVDTTGAPINFASVAGIDVYTDANRVNTLVAVNGQTLYTIDLAQLTPGLALGTTQKVIAKGVGMIPMDGEIRSTDSFIDVAIPVANVAPPPAAPPTATPTPTPAAGPRCTVDFRSIPEAGGKFRSQVSIRNNTGSDFNPWELTFSFGSGQVIANATSATVKQKGAAVRINGSPVNARLANGGTVSFRLDGESKGSNAPPVNFSLNGTPCNK